SGVLAAPIMPTLVRELLTALQLPFEQLRVIPHGAGPPFRTCRKGLAVLSESRRWSARAKHRYRYQEQNADQRTHTVSSDTVPYATIRRALYSNEVWPFY